MSLNIKQEVARMKGMTTSALREHFETVCLEPPRSRNRDWMIKKIAWRLQANEQGGLPERVRQRALAMADDADLRKRPPQSFTEQISLAVEETTVIDKDQAEIARVAGVTRARVTQIINLTNLAPDIQQAILDLEPTADPVPRFREREVRTIAILPNWETQRVLWKRLIKRAG